MAANAPLVGDSIPAPAAWRQKAGALLPVLWASAYPWLLQLAHAVATQPRTQEAYAIAARAFIVLPLMFAAPAGGLWQLLRLAQAGRASVGQLRLRVIAVLVLATPPLFTLVGVEVWLAGIAPLEKVIWLAIWLPLLVVAQRAGGQALRAQPLRPPQAAWRVSHGLGALLLLLAFVGLHLANHLLGLVNADTHLRVMQALRHWYRAAAIEPALLALCALQLLTGYVLARRWLSRAIADIPRAVQIGTGVYLGLYLVCHLNSVFVYARAGGIETDFWFASGGPAGLMGDGWNARLLPHYGLAVLFLFAHVGAGLRMVLLAHGYQARGVMAAAWAIGALVALGAVLPLLRIHLA